MTTDAQRATRWPAGTEPARFGSIEEFLASGSIPSGDLEIDGGLPVHLHWEDHGHDVLFVTFTGAVSSAHRTVPSFSGKGITKGLAANLLLVSDPSLKISSRLRLAWYTGSRQLPNFQEELSRVIGHLAGDSRVVLFGSSGGGFAALEAGSRLPGSRVITANPQTFLPRYHAPAYDRFTEIAWETGPTAPGTPADLPAVQDVTEVYSRPLDTEVLYLQGSRDRFHRRDHQAPFLEKLHPDTRHLSVTEDFGPGHAPPGKELLRAVFDAAVRDDDWEVFTASVAAIRADPALLAPAQAAGAADTQRPVRQRIDAELHAFPDLDSFFTRPAGVSGNLVIQHGLPIHLHWKDNGAATTVVTFQSAVPPAITSVPVFASQFTLKMEDVNVLLVSDPSLILDRGLAQGWYAGNPKQADLALTLTDIITSLAGTTRVLLLGVGAGGYAALDQGTRIPGSAVLAMNPSFDIMEDPSGLGERYGRLVWGESAELLGTVDSPIRTSCAISYQRPVPASVVVVDSTADPDYAKEQVDPFFHGLHPANAAVRVAVTLPKGRRVPGRDQHEAWIRAIVQEPDWSDLQAVAEKVTGI